MPRTITLKMILIFFSLILLAMEVVGVYLYQSLERYYLSTYASSLNSQGEMMAGLLGGYLRGGQPGGAAGLDRMLQGFGGGNGEEIMVVGRYGVVLGDSRPGSQAVGHRLLQPQILRALGGHHSQWLRRQARTKDPRLAVAIPIREGGRVAGALYLQGSLAPIYQVLSRLQLMLLMATLLALATSGVLGVVMARAITRPIRALTARAAAMAAGDFEQEIQVRSNDEVGRLGEMFNHLTARLRVTMAEMVGEKDKLATVLANLADGVVAVDATGAVILANRVACDLLGCDDAAVTGRPLRELWSAAEVELPEGGASPGVREVHLPSGRTVRAQFASLGRDGGTVVLLRDVTEERKLDELRRDFVANVSHELRTPLTILKSYLETLLGGAVQQDRRLTRRFLLVLQRETDRMVRMVNDLLQLSRLDYQQGPGERRSVDLAALLREVTGGMALGLERRGLALRLGLPSTLPGVSGDPEQLKQVLNNLLENAVKFTPRGGRVTVEVVVQEQAVYVKVCDTGMGIPPEDLPRIFERFYRVEKGRSRQHGGTGLGLSIVRQIVESHGGAVWAESQVGQGTCVTFSLPRPKIDPGEEERSWSG
ncbi:MAG: ATP-binding protein [Thermaerobacter sp.]|nr:ATP-binding protein [Thermaerobacter sp.]